MDLRLATHVFQKVNSAKIDGSGGILGKACLKRKVSPSVGERFNRTTCTRIIIHPTRPEPQRLSTNQGLLRSTGSVYSAGPQGGLEWADVHGMPIWLGVKSSGIPFWLVGEFTTHVRTYFRGWIESDVHWGYGLWDFDPRAYVNP